MSDSFLENGDGLGPLGLKGLGEGGILAVGPAMCGAILDLTGRLITEIPVTPERLWRALSGPGAERAGMSRAATPVVDVHIHAVPPALVAAVESGSLPVGAGAAGGGEAGVHLPRAWLPRRPARRAWATSPAWRTSPPPRASTRQVVGPWTDLLGYTLPAAEAAAWSRAYNEALAAACAAHRGRSPWPPFR